MYISLDILYEEGLLKAKAESFRENTVQIDYDAVRAFKEPYLREAFTAFCAQGKQNEDAYKDFASQDWVYEYSVFCALKKKHGGSCWNEWTAEAKNWPETRTSLSEELEAEVQYQMFLQYQFFSQWMRLKEEANAADVQIMGDVPFYVGVDSVDVWAGKQNFLLDTDGRPIFIAGVPPDYFSVTGQRWGNPIYDWDYLKENEYQFWVDRIGYSSKLFDIIRIDHFRAFDTFWKIPASCPTAIEGEWIEAPGYEVIDTLKAKIQGVNLVAEDLEDLRPEVLELKNHYHLKGMKILVFSIETNGKYAYDSFHDVENMIIYTGTHDNDTLMEWYGKLTCAAQRKIRPMADVLGQGREGHLNTPGTVGSPNWEWRMPDFTLAEKEMKKYKNLFFRQ